MSLLGSRKFWATRMRWRTRCCYLSGFCYYVHTALFTFAAPAIPLVMLIFIPERVRLINYLFIVPSMIYNLVVFPAWHRCRFGPEALMAKLLYGWAHRVRPLGHLPPQANGLAGYRRRQAEGRDAPHLGRPDRLERRHRTGLGDAGGVAHDASYGAGFHPAARHRPARLCHHRDGARRAPQPRTGRQKGRPDEALTDRGHRGRM